MSLVWRAVNADCSEAGPVGGYVYQIRSAGSGFRVFQINGTRKTRSQWCSTPDAARKIAESWAGATSTVERL
jgi:hypothetical protein